MSDTAATQSAASETRPLLRRAIRGRRLPESLQTAVRLDRRTVIGRDAVAFRKSLLAHVGGQPSAAQAGLIDIAVQLRMRVVAMDAKFAERGEQSAHDAKQYLAWSNSLSRTLIRLGLQAAAQQQPTIHDLMAAMPDRPRTVSPAPPEAA